MIGHHGTDRVSGHEIIKQDSQFEISRMDKRRELWLGDGVYFFLNNEKMALEWCKAESYKKKNKEYAIIVSRIKARVTEIFDLDSPDGYELFHGHRDIVLERLGKANFSISTPTPDTRDGSLINELCTLFPFKVVKLTCFVARVKERIMKLYSRIPNCTMISVRDQECILDRNLQKEGVLSVN